MSKTEENFDRRKFIKGAAVASAIGLPALVSACAAKSSEEISSGTISLSFLDQAPEGEPIKIGLIGCGSRGTGALMNLLDSGPSVEVVALADIFEDKLVRCKRELYGVRNVQIPESKCFIGFDAYKKLLETEVNLVVLATPPYFRPDQFAAAVEAGKHIFMEKPVAVDPVGVRSILASAKLADQKGLKVGVGTQRRHQRDYLTCLEHIKQGAIGNIISANCYWNQGALWHAKPQPGWNEMEAMLRNWVNWSWLSGDHIVEQHLHNIDVINWFTGKLPVSAVGVGSRQKRITGDQYDNFSVDYVYEDGMHMHSMCRQIDHCANNVSELLVGTKGSTNCQNKIFDSAGNIIWEYDYAAETPEAPAGSETLKVEPYTQQSIDLITAIRTNQPYNEAADDAKSALVAIMGREAAYSGREVHFEEIMQSDLKMGPEKISLGPVDYDVVIPSAGNPM